MKVISVSYNGYYVNVFNQDGNLIKAIAIKPELKKTRIFKREKRQLIETTKITKIKKDDRKPRGNDDRNRPAILGIYSKGTRIDDVKQIERTPIQLYNEIVKLYKTNGYEVKGA